MAETWADLDSKEQLRDWLIRYKEKYQHKLVFDVYAAGEPPLATFNDFELAPQWPESIVAQYLVGDLEGTESYYGPAKGFKVRSDLLEV
jgi:hypothetical protein